MSVAREKDMYAQAQVPRIEREVHTIARMKVQDNVKRRPGDVQGVELPHQRAFNVYHQPGNSKPTFSDTAPLPQRPPQITQIHATTHNLLLSDRRNSVQFPA